MARWAGSTNSFGIFEFPFIFICFHWEKVSKSKGQGKVYKRLSGVVMSPSVKTFICWQPQHWVSWEGYRGKTQFTQDRWWWIGALAGSFQIQGGVMTVPVTSFSYRTSKKNDFFIFAPWNEFALSCQELTICLALKALLVHSFGVFSSSWKGDLDGGWGRRSLWKVQAWCGMLLMHYCILPKGRDVISQFLSKLGLFQTNREQALVSTSVAPRDGTP